MAVDPSTIATTLRLNGLTPSSPANEIHNLFAEVGYTEADITQIIAALPTLPFEAGHSVDSATPASSVTNTTTTATVSAPVSPAPSVNPIASHINRMPGEVPPFPVSAPTPTSKPHIWMLPVVVVLIIVIVVDATVFFLSRNPQILSAIANGSQASASTTSTNP